MVGQSVRPAFTFFDDFNSRALKICITCLPNSTRLVSPCIRPCSFSSLVFPHPPVPPPPPDPYPRPPLYPIPFDSDSYHICPRLVHQCVAPVANILQSTLDIGVLLIWPITPPAHDLCDKLNSFDFDALFVDSSAARSSSSTTTTTTTTCGYAKHMNCVMFYKI